jgi:hypothetical protein
MKVKHLQLSDYLKRKDQLFDKRQEYKFLVPIKHLNELVDYLSKDFFLVKRGESSSSLYSTRYFDTENFHFFNQHRKGKYNRLKVRMRSYVDNEAFLECKRKVKGLIVKKRRENLKKLEGHFLHEELEKEGKSLEDLVNRVDISYLRIFFVSKDYKRRVTIDYDIRYEHQNQKGILTKDYVILEVKQQGYPKDLAKFLVKNFKVREGNFSKYCLTVCKVKPDLKINKWKQILKNYCHEV